MSNIAAKQLTEEEQEKLKRFDEFKTVEITDIDKLNSGDLLLVKKGVSIEVVTIPFGKPSIIEEDGSLFIATKAHTHPLTQGDLCQILDCIAFKRDDKIYPYAVKVLCESEAVYVLLNDFMNPALIGTMFVQIDTATNND